MLRQLFISIYAEVLQVSVYIDLSLGIFLHTAHSRTASVLFYSQGSHTSYIVIFLNYLWFLAVGTLNSASAPPQQHSIFVLFFCSFIGNNSPSSPLSCSSPKLLLSPQQGSFSLQNYSSKFANRILFCNLAIGLSFFHSILMQLFATKFVAGPRSRQSSVEHTDTPPAQAPITQAELYRQMQKTTAEIQTYYETKLDRDANSKDSGISQMGDHQMEHFLASSTTTLLASTPSHANGHALGFDRDELCNGDSKTQSSTATTTKSNTPENAVRLDAIDGSVSHHRGLVSKTPHFTMSDDGELLFESKYDNGRHMIEFYYSYFYLRLQII